MATAGFETPAEFVEEPVEESIVSFVIYSRQYF